MPSLRIGGNETTWDTSGYTSADYYATNEAVQNKAVIKMMKKLKMSIQDGYDYTDQSKNLYAN